MSKGKDKKIAISVETLEQYAEQVVLDTTHFETDQEIEVRIPVEAYLTVTLKCSDPQSAMLAALNTHNLIGILSLTTGSYVLGDIYEEEVHCIVKDTKKVSV